VGSVGIDRNITLSKHVKNALRESVEWLKIIFEYAPDGYYLNDIKGNFIDCNKAAEELIGYRREELIGKNFLLMNFLSPKQILKASKLLAKNALGKRTGPDEFTLKRKDGTYITVEIKTYPVNVKNQTIVLGIARDITERKKAEESLHESEKKYWNLFENLYDAAFLIDTETGIILESNKQAEVLLGRPREEIIGMHHTRLCSSDKVEKCQQMFEDCISLGYCKVSVTEVIKKNDITIPFEINAQMLTLGGKNLIICLFHDLTDRKRAEEEEKLHQLQLIQTEKLASLGQVVTGIAHEINNPNSFITYNVPLLEETWEMFKPVLKEYAEAHLGWRINDIGFEELIQDMSEIIYSIRIGSERINKIVGSLKDYARVNETSHKKLVNVNEIIKKTMIIVGTQVKKSVGYININLADNLPEIQGNFQKLEQVVANLVVNSVHAIPDKEGGKISISTRYIDRLRSVLIEVEDNGDGIEPDLVNRIFDPFFTTRRNEEGTGLGLSVSYSLVQEHNGIIGVLSKPGVGTRFTVFLPVERDVKLDLRPLILCVDDDKTVLDIFKKYFLRIENMLFETTCQSEKVLEYIDEHPEVDIVISDIKMPVVDGWEISQKVKEKYPLLTVILYSGYPGKLQKKEGIDVKPDYLIEKPVDFKRLELILKSIVRQKL